MLFYKYLLAIHPKEYYYFVWIDIEHEDGQSNHINLPTINASDFLMYYANETEKQNNINHKKKKKKQDRNNQMRR